MYHGRQNISSGFASILAITHRIAPGSQNRGGQSRAMFQASTRCNSASETSSARNSSSEAIDIANLEVAHECNCVNSRPFASWNSFDTKS